jgi:hypothetical protein
VQRFTCVCGSAACLAAWHYQPASLLPAGTANCLTSCCALPSSDHPLLPHPTLSESTTSLLVSLTVLAGSSPGPWCRLWVEELREGAVRMRKDSFLLEAVERSRLVRYGVGDSSAGVG